MGLPEAISLTSLYFAYFFFRAALMRRCDSTSSFLRVGSRIWAATSLRRK
jgi:hypothetical protein